MTTETQTCKTCLETKPLSEFTKLSKSLKTEQLYYKKECKPCTSLKLSTKYRLKNPNSNPRGRVSFNTKFPEKLPLIRIALNNKQSKVSICKEFDIPYQTLFRYIRNGLI